MLPLAYAAIAGGALLLVAGLTGSTIPSVAKGVPDRAHAAGPQVTETASASAASSASSPPVSATAHGAWRATQAAIAKQRGWSLPDWNAVISKESGGDPTSRNASSGAYGLGQFLGATARTYAPFGALSPNPVLQIKAMAKYIGDRYGNPTAALAHEHAYGWY